MKFWKVSVFLVAGVIAGAGAAISQEAPRAGPRLNVCAEDSKIVGGCLAKVKDWPGFVALRARNAEKRQSGYFCGGTLISRDWVLTAAHCVHNTFTKVTSGRHAAPFSTWGYNEDPFKFEGEGLLEVVLGQQNLDAVGPDDLREVIDIVIHPKYNGVAQNGYDVALLKLRPGSYRNIAELSASLERDPKPTLPQASTPVAENYAMVAGYGSQWFGVNPLMYPADKGAKDIYAAGSNELLEVTVPLVSEQICKSAYPSDKINSRVICAGFAQGGKDSCQGDSGGPLMAYNASGQPYQIGVVSWGEDCAKEGYYGIYTRVSAFAGWVKLYVNDAAWQQ